MGRAHNVDRLKYSATGRDIYFRSDGSLKRISDTVVNPDMAGTLRLIAAEGADVFYSGELETRISRRTSRPMAGRWTIGTLPTTKPPIMNRLSRLIGGSE